MKMLIRCFIIFLSGFIFSANIETLIEVNPNYEQANWKALLALLIGIYVSAVIAIDKELGK